MSKGLNWFGFSISGHAFILIYCTLIIMEEAKALIGWEAIKDHLRNEEHNRMAADAGVQTPLDSLSTEQLSMLKEKYEKFTPYIRIAFIFMTMLTIIWDVMLVVSTFSTPLCVICIHLFYYRLLSFISILPQRNLQLVS